MTYSYSKKFLETSIAVMISAIEVYNKPDHKYREESFSILALNAWEIFFKAKILLEKKNGLKSLYVYSNNILKDRSKGKRRVIKKNRCNNPMTISLMKAMSIIENEKLGIIDKNVRNNIEALMEIRDNSIHLINMNNLSKKVQELGSATLINYLALMKEWFSRDLREYNFYLMPLAFLKDLDSIYTLKLTKEEYNIDKYLSTLQSESTSTTNEKYSFSLKLNVQLEKLNSAPVAKLAIGDSLEAIPITLRDDEILKKYTWDYKLLTENMNARYSDFKLNHKYHSIRKSLLDNPDYAFVRILNPKNKNSAKTCFYHPDILTEFDKHYERI